MMLTFDSVGAQQYLVECVKEASEEVMNWFVGETRGLGSGSGLSAAGQAATELSEVEAIGAGIVRQQCIFYADAIVDSYGTGSLADTGERSFWKEYSAQKGANGFNPSRTTKYIAGRPRGSYSDIWGKRHSTWGTLEGLNIEGLEFIDSETGKLVKIEPMAASYAIQNAEKWLTQSEGRCKRAIIAAAEKWVSKLDEFFIER